MQVENILHDRAAVAARTVGTILGVSAATVRACYADGIANGRLVRLSTGAVVHRRWRPPGPRVPMPGLSAVDRREALLLLLGATVSPSLREMARFFEVGLPTIQGDLRLLERGGVLFTDPTLARGHQVRLTGEPWQETRPAGRLSVTPWAERHTHTDRVAVR